jgi:hypothetical protein
VGVVVILLSMHTVDIRERHAVASRFLALGLTCSSSPMDMSSCPYCDPTPNPSPQGGGEQSEFAFRLLRSQQDVALAFPPAPEGSSIFPALPMRLQRAARR